MIAEAPCVLVRAGRGLHLVVRDGGPARVSPLAWANLVRLVAGDAAFDLAWSSAEGGDGAAVAAAMAARLHGDILGEPVLRGLDMRSGLRFELRPPPEWWHGGWTVRPRGVAAPARVVAARLLLHGEIVLG